MWMTIYFQSHDYYSRFKVLNEIVVIFKSRLCLCIATQGFFGNFTKTSAYLLLVIYFSSPISKLYPFVLFII